MEEILDKLVFSDIEWINTHARQFDKGQTLTADATDPFSYLRPHSLVDSLFRLNLTPLSSFWEGKVARFKLGLLIRVFRLLSLPLTMPRDIPG